MTVLNGIQQVTVLANGAPSPFGTPAGTQPAAGAPQTGTVAAPVYVPQGEQDAPGGFFGGGGSLFLIWALVIGVFWMLMIRPQRKREKKLKELQASIKTGDNVVTNSGMYGRVADVTAECFVVELGIGGRSVKIPMRKTDVLGIAEPNLSPAVEVV